MRVRFLETLLNYYLKSTNILNGATAFATISIIIIITMVTDTITPLFSDKPNPISIVTKNKKNRLRKPLPIFFLSVFYIPLQLCH